MALKFSDLFRLAEDACAYKGRLKRKNLSDDELKQVQMKAQQLRYIGVRQQLKLEEHKDKAEKMRRKMEEKARKE